MAGPMRDNSLDGSHRTKVADPRAATAAKAETNFEYDDNEWDIGIGDLIIDLDADIEKTNEKTSSSGGATVSMASAAGGPPTKGKLAIEHSATVDKGLKMKIKRTKPGTKTSEAKHEIVKSGEQQNGSGEKHNTGNSANNSASGGAGVKRGSSGHRRDKAREKHEVNGVVRPPVQRVVFPVTVSGPGPPNAPGPPPSEPPPVPSPATPPAPHPPPTLLPQPTLEEPKLVPASPSAAAVPPSSPPPPPKKLKPSCLSDISKEMVDVCVGTSVGTITEPDCLGPCEPGTSVTLEGIVWHETEGVLVVNVTWRGKTYVGTLLDCTRHDWAPPRFCDSPTSDLDARTPKGRGKRGRQATGTTTNNDLSNFTETRSSVHSKLRSNNNGGAKGRRNPGGPGSPTPFVPPKPDSTPGKRKPKAPEEEAPATKKSKPPPPPPTPTPNPTPPSSSSSSSPPPSPVLLECPEPNCSKKYKHINGLKYHQSHAHGNADDEETKESAGSLSEAEEAPSPTPAVKKEGEPSPAEVPAPKTPTPTPIEVPITSPQQPPSAPTPTPTPEVEPPPIPPPSPPDKSVIKTGVLRFGAQEDTLLIPTVTPTSRPVQSNASLQPSSPRQPSPAPNPQQTPIQLVIQSQTQAVTPHVVQIAPTLTQQNPAINAKVPQFKVKPTSVLMPDDKKVVKPPSHKKKSRKSPAGSPHPHPHLLEPQPLGLETGGGREDVQSPAYSDISDDGAPVLDPEIDGSKGKPTAGDKKVEVNSGQSPHSMQHYNMYNYYGQPPYLVPSVTTDKPKDNTNDKSLEAKPGLEKEKKDGSNAGGEFQQKILSHNYYPYGYVPGYPYNLEPGYSVPMVTEEKPSVIKEEKSPGPIESMKQNLPPAPTTLHVPNPSKIKTEPGTKEKHPNENHQILKESIEMKNQMSPAYLYTRPQQQQTQAVQQQDDMRRYYIYPERRKDHTGQSENPQGLKATPPPQPKQSVTVPSPKHKDKPIIEDKKEEKVKQEGVKPTMETQGPPPPPTSSYAYIHPGYMQSPHYGAIPFDPSHSMYARGINPMIVPSPYPNNPYIHPQLHPPMPRYHAPEDLSRPPPGGPKALDLLQHHANQYYTSHKIHELQERALKSPTPKATVASASPSAERGQAVGAISGPQGTPSSTNSSQPPVASGKTAPSDNKDSRSPPPQRHVHTHHHTHVGLGYPILTGQYPASYGAAVLASQQAAAVASSVISPFSPNAK